MATIRGWLVAALVASGGGVGVTASGSQSVLLDTSTTGRDIPWQSTADNSGRLAVRHVATGGIAFDGGEAGTGGSDWEGALVPLRTTEGDSPIQLTPGQQLWVEFDWEIQQIRSGASVMQVALMNLPAQPRPGENPADAHAYRALFSADTTSSDQRSARLEVGRSSWRDTTRVSERPLPLGWDPGAERRLRFVIQASASHERGDTRLLLADVTEGYDVLAERIIEDRVSPRVNMVLLGMRRLYPAKGELGGFNRVRVIHLQEATLQAETTTLRTGAVHLRWAYPEQSNGTERFAIYRADGREGFADRPVFVGTGREWIDRDTTAGLYRYRVVPLSADGEEFASGDTARARVEKTLPAQPPLRFEAITRNEEMELTWQLPEESRAAMVRLYRLPKGNRNLRQARLVTEAAPEQNRRLRSGDAENDRRLIEVQPEPPGTGRVRVAVPAEPAATDWAAVVVAPGGGETDPVYVPTTGIVPRSPYHGNDGSSPTLLLNQEEIEHLRRRIDADPDYRTAYEQGLLQEAETAWDALRPENRNIPHQRSRVHGDIWRQMRQAALGYAFTGESRFAEVVRDTLLEYSSFYSDQPIPRAYADTYLADSHVEGRWFVDVTWAYDLIKRTLSESDRQAIIEGLFRPGAEILLTHNRWFSNWQSGHNAGLIALAIVMDDEDLYRHALHGPGGLMYQIEHSIRQDGLWAELSIAYHYYAMHAITIAAEMAYRRGDDVFAIHIGDRSLRAFYDGSFYHAFSNLNQATFGNSQTDRQLKASWVGWNYAIAYARYDQPHYRWMWEISDILQDRLIGEKMPPLLQLRYLEEGRTTSEPLAVGTGAVGGGIRNVMGSTLFKHSGVGVLRGAPGRATPEAAINYKPYGKFTGHMHPDTLGLYWQSPAHRWLPSTGKWASYSSDLHKNWVFETLSDNLVVVDRRSQEPVHGDHGVWVNDPAGWSSHGRLENFSAGMNFGYMQVASDRINPGVDHRRRLFLTDTYTLDVYRVESDRLHLYDWVAHVAGNLEHTSVPLTPRDRPLANNAGYQYLSDLRTARSSSDWTTRWTARGANEEFYLTTLGAPATTLYLARAPWSDGTRGAVLVNRRSRKANFVSLFGIAQDEADAVPEVTWLHEVPFEDHPASGAVRVTTKDYEDYHAWHDQSMKGSAGPIEYDAQAVMYRHRNVDGLEEVMMIKGNLFRSDTGLSIESEAPTTLSFKPLDKNVFLLAFDDEYSIRLKISGASLPEEVAAYRLSGEGIIEDHIAVESTPKGITLMAEPRSNYLIAPAARQPDMIDCPPMQKQLDQKGR